MHALSLLLARFAFLRFLALLLLVCGSITPALAGKTYSDNDDGTVTDPTTGLVWMRCSMGQTWNGTTCTGKASAYTFDQANALTGTLTFAGQSDWRVPNIRELQTIVDRTVFNPAIDSVVFPAAPSSSYWSGSPYAAGSSNAWHISFGLGNVYDGYRSSPRNVRLVRGGQSVGGLLDISRPTSDYRDNGDGTVTHIPTNLMWKHCAEGQSWNGSTCTGVVSSMTFEQAQAVSKSFNGKNDWRIPSADELISLVDYRKTTPAYNTSVFPAAGSSFFWSGSFSAEHPSFTWFVHLGYGLASYYYDRINSYGVRLVRGGQCLGPLILSVSSTGLGQITSSAYNGIACISVASSTGYFTGDVVTLTASPANNLIAWSGACSGTAATCTVTMDAAKFVTATFKDVPVVSGLPATQAFAKQNIASTSAAQTVILSNTGTATMNITSIAATGDFNVTNNCGAGIGAGGFCTLDVSFKPTAGGTRTGTLTLTSDAPGSPHTIALTGIGQGALLSLSATSKNFASQKQGTSSAAQAITLSNTGGAVLNISSITATGDFAKITSCGATLAPSASCSISVTFAPTAVGPLSGSVVITSDASNSPNTVSLSGTGLAVPVVALNPTTMSFPATALGSTSAVQTIKLTNTGGAVLSLTSISTTGDFAVTNNCGAGLGASGFCDLSVTFSPRVAGSRVGTVTITSNAPGSPHTVAVSASTSLTLLKGWNLLGNSQSQPLPVATTFGDPSLITTVWKWDPSTPGWKFYTPSLMPAELQDYTTGKGYGILSDINPGEGYWVNATAPATLDLQSAAPFNFTNDNLVKGWNLVATGNDVSPTAFNTSLRATPPAYGLTTLWAWDSAQSKWYFYAPDLEAQSSTALTDYITGKGYLDFTAGSKTLGNGTGFWVDKPESSVAVNVAPVANAGIAQSVVAGSVVILDGSASSDANGGKLTYAWTLTSKPAGSDAALSSSTAVKPTYTVDVAGTYVASLVVNDGQLNSVVKTVAITAVSDLNQLFGTGSSSAGSSMNGIKQAGSQFSSTISNKSNETFSISQYEFQNGSAVLSSSTNLTLLSGGDLIPAESVGVTSTLAKSAADNGFRGVYYLTLTRTGEQFTVVVNFN